MKNKGNINFIRADKNRNYSVIYTEVLQRADISLQAKGLFAFFMTMPDDRKIVKANLKTFFKNGRNACNSAMNELEELGYVTKKPNKLENGQLSGWSYTIK